MSIYSGSRYAYSRRRIRDGKTYLTVPERASFTASKCSLYQVVEGDTVDGIAYKFYGDAALWWCIMDANREFMSELEIKPGVTLQIPSKDEVDKVVI